MVTFNQIVKNFYVVIIIFLLSFLFFQNRYNDIPIPHNVSEKLSFPQNPPKPTPSKGRPSPWRMVTKPRDTSLYTTSGNFLNIPQHIEAAGVNIFHTALDSWKAGKSIYDMPADMGNIIGKPNEPLPSDTNISKIINNYT